MIRAAAVAIVLAVAAPAAADSERWSPTTIVNAGVQAGFESPGVAVVGEIGVGHRIRGTIWHLRGARMFAGGIPGGGSTSLSFAFWDVRVGPTWWSCVTARCVGGSIDGGLQYMRVHETGGDGPVPSDVHRRNYDAILDLRLRYLVASPDEPIAIEANVGLRFKVRVYDTGGYVNQGGERLGAGLLLGLGVNAVF